MPPQNTSNTSGLNTVLIVIVLLALVAFGVWWFTSRTSPTPAENAPGINIQATFPTGEAPANAGADEAAY